MNWDAFAQQVSAGIQRGASGWSGTIRADIERKKDMQDRLAIMQQNQEYQEKNQKIQFENETARQAAGFVYSKKLSEFDQKANADEKRNYDTWKANSQTFLEDPVWKASLAQSTMMGNAPKAKAEWDLVQRLLRKEKPRNGDDVILAGMPKVAQSKANQLVADAVSFQEDLAYRKSYSAYLASQKDMMTDKKELTLTQAMDQFEDATAKADSIMDGIDAIQKDIGTQSAMQAASKYKTKEEFQQKDPTGYGRWMDIQYRLGARQELLANQRDVQMFWQGTVSRMRGLPEKPPEPTDLDKQAQTEAAKPTEAPKPKGEGLIHKIGGDIDAFLGAQSTGGVSSKSIAKKYGIKDSNKVLVIRYDKDMANLRDGLATVPPGTYIYDALNQDMFRAAGDGFFIQVGSPKLKSIPIQQ